MILIRSKKYKEILKERDLYQKYFWEEEKKVNGLKMEIASLNNNIKELCEINERIVERSEDYKRKFLDEQQKRLFLAELIKKLEGESEEKPKTEEKPVTCRECKYLVYDPSYVHCTKGHDKSMRSLEYSCGEGKRR